MVPCEGTFYHSLRHARTDSRNDLKHTKDPTDRFQSSFRFVLLDLIRLSFRVPRVPPIGLLACQAPPKTAMHDANLRTKHLHVPSQNRASGLRKMEPRALWNGKNAFAAVLKKIMRCRGVSKHLRFPPPKSQIFVGQTMDCLMPR